MQNWNFPGDFDCKNKKLPAKIRYQGKNSLKIKNPLTCKPRLRSVLQVDVILIFPLTNLCPSAKKWNFACDFDCKNKKLRAKNKMSGEKFLSKSKFRWPVYHALCPQFLMFTVKIESEISILGAFYRSALGKIWGNIFPGTFIFAHSFLFLQSKSKEVFNFSHGQKSAESWT